MEKGNELYTNTDKITENQKVVKGSEKDVVQGSENTDTNLANILDLEEIKKLNRNIGRRIIEIMNKSGMNQEQFYTLLYPNSKEADGTKRNRMGDILNAAAFDGKLGAKLLDFPRLLFISQYFHVPLNDLLYGEAEPTTETPPAQQKEKATAEKSETEIDTSLPTDEYALEKSLLDIKLPVLQTSAVLINLFKYANISIVDKDYDMDNFDYPQSLTIKISPRCFVCSGSYGEEGFRRSYGVVPAPKGFGTITSAVYWDVRATLVQRALAAACLAVKSRTFNPDILFRSVFKEMEKYKRYGNRYHECKESDADYFRLDYPFIRLSSYSIFHGIRQESLPLSPCRDESYEIHKQLREIKKNKTKEELESLSTDLHNTSLYHDPLSCTLNCEYDPDKIPDDLLGTALDIDNDDYLDDLYCGGLYGYRGLI